MAAAKAIGMAAKMAGGISIMAKSGIESISENSENNMARYHGVWRRKKNKNQ
jgi:hypothetical protein